MKKQVTYDILLMVWTLVLILVLLAMIGCKTEAKVKYDCTSKAMILPLRDGRILSLPAYGKVVMESHYVTNDDVFPTGVYPSYIDEHISFHLEESCGLLGKTNCMEVYASKYARQWTPSEGGQIGQGSRGRHRLSMKSELWAATMNLKSNFPPDTRMLAKFGSKAVVLSIGHEIGPSTKHIMGMSPEAHWYLGTNNESMIEVEYPIDQALPFGPIDCR